MRMRTSKHCLKLNLLRQMYEVKILHRNSYDRYGLENKDGLHCVRSKYHVRLSNLRATEWPYHLPFHYSYH